MTHAARQALAKSKRVIVKVGSRALMTGRFEALAEQLTTIRDTGKQVLLVSSGAVAAGRDRLGFEQRPKGLAQLQAAAAAGQSILMRTYEDAFEARGVHIAQVLLTHGDLSEKGRADNVKRTLQALFDLDVVTIINENDAVAVEELTVGDNDRLAAMVAALVGADALIMLTDVDGVLDASGARVSVVSDLSQVQGFVQPSNDDVGLGGMGSKIEAASEAAERGIATVVANAATERVVEAVLRGDDIGTLFVPNGKTEAKDGHWIP